MTTLTGSIIDSTFRQTATTSLTGVPIGTPSSDRVVFIYINCASFFDPATVSIGGVTAQFTKDGTGIGGSGWIWANIPTGTTATVSVSDPSGFTIYGVWATTGSASARITSTQGSFHSSFPPTTISTSAFSVGAGDLLIGQAQAGTRNAPTLAFTAGLGTTGTLTTNTVAYWLNGIQSYASAVSQAVTATFTQGTSNFASTGLVAAQITSPPTVSLTALSMLLSSGRSGIAGSASLLAHISSRLSQASGHVTATSNLAAKSVASVKTTSGIEGIVSLATLSSAMVKAGSILSSTTLLSARSQAMSTAKPGMKATAFLDALTRSMGASRTGIKATTQLSATTRSAAAMGAKITASMQLLARSEIKSFGGAVARRFIYLLAQSRTILSAGAAMRLFVPSSRVARTQATSRTVTTVDQVTNNASRNVLTLSQPRSVQAPAVGGRTVAAESKSRTAKTTPGD